MEAFPRASDRAFTLIETVVALAILGLVLTAMISLLAQESVFDRRMAAQLEAQRGLEAVHEAVRAGLALPLAEAGVHELEPILEPELVEDFVVEATIEPLQPAGLYRIDLHASYRLGREKLSQSIESRIWRP